MSPRLALEGIRVIDLTQMVAGPVAGGLLAQWGAEVIHIERPVLGDGGRGFGRGGVLRQHKVNYAWELPNMNKKSLTADVSLPEGREIIHKLAAKSDVFLSNLRPREIDKFNLTYQTLKNINEKIIYANLNGYGPNGPDRNEPGWDADAYFARSGIIHSLSELAEAPIQSRPAFGDVPSGMACACGIMVALFAREKLGIGQEVNTSLFNCGVWATMFDMQGSLLTKQDPPRRQKRELAGNPLKNTYKTKDGRWIILSMIQSDRYWPSFCRAIEQAALENDPRFNSIEKRSENNRILIDIIDQSFAGKTVDEWKKRLTEFGLGFSLIQKPSEVIEDPQARANGFFTAVDHPNYGPIELILAPIKLSETPAAFRNPAPELGQHTEEILLDLGYDWDQITQLKDRNVIG